MLARLYENLGLPSVAGRGSEKEHQKDEVSTVTGLTHCNAKDTPNCDGQTPEGSFSKALPVSMRNWETNSSDGELCNDCKVWLKGYTAPNGFSNPELFERNFLEDEELFLTANSERLHQCRLDLENSFVCEFSTTFDKWFKTNEPRLRLRLLQMYECLYIRSVAYSHTKNFLEFGQGQERINLSKLYSPKSISTSFGVTYVGNATTSSSHMEFYDFMRDGTLIDSGDEQFDEFVRSYYFTNQLDDSGVSGLQKRLIQRNLLAKIVAIKTRTNNSCLFTLNGYNCVMRFLVAVENDLLKKVQNREATPIIELLGGAGLGKSSTVKSFATFLNCLCPNVPANEMVYVRTNDRFWNGYTGQPIVLYDDVSHAKMQYDVARELVDIGSGVLSNPPMAFEKDMKYTSIYCFVTSNIPIATTGRTQELRDALARRITSYDCSPYSGACRVVTNGANSRFVYTFRGRVMNALKIGNIKIFDLVSNYLSSSGDVSKFELDFDVDFGLNDIQQDLSVAFEESLVEHRRVFRRTTRGLKRKLVEPAVENFSLFPEQSMLTSSVPESYSALVDCFAPSEGVCVSAELETPVGVLVSSRSGKREPSYKKRCFRTKKLKLSPLTAVDFSKSRKVKNFRSKCYFDLR